MRTNDGGEMVLRKITHAHSEMNPFARDSYFYPAPYLQLPSNGASIRAFRLPTPNREDRQMAINKDVTTIVEFGRNYFEDRKKPVDDREKLKLIKTVQKIVKEMNEKGNAALQQEQAVLVEKQPPNDSLNIMVVSPSFDSSIGTGRSSGTKQANSSSAQSSKTFSRPSKVTKVKSPIVPQQPPQQHQQLKATKVDDSQEPSAKDEDGGQFKGPFSSYFNNQKEQVVEALKQGGVIIQRLRVRNGGIAIAGPNGVATAGSGGTAIVGPGGIALTHPRSLTIAGPGARVIAVPETTDLQELALRSSARDLSSSFDGLVVATGPVVYYSPDTSS